MRSTTSTHPTVPGIVFATLAETVESLEANGRESGESGMWQCPAHDDRTPSLSISTSAKGDATLVKCFAGCPADEIGAALGLRTSAAGKRRTANVVPLSAKRAPKQEPAEKQPKDLVITRIKTNTYPYKSPEGITLWSKARYRQVHESGKVSKTFTQFPAVPGRTVSKVVAALVEAGTPVPVYRGNDVRKLVADGKTHGVVVEGEKDVDALSAKGYPAACSFGGAKGKVDLADWDVFAGCELVTIIADNDEPGAEYARLVTAQLTVRGIASEILRSPLETPGADWCDHAEAGLSFEDLIPLSPVPAAAGNEDGRDSDSDGEVDWEAEGFPEGDAGDFDNSQADRKEQAPSWRPVDLARILSDTVEEETATVLTRSDGACLFYAGKVNGVFGESESGKSLVLQWGAAAAILAGKDVLIIDFEDTARTVVRRLRGMFGVTDELISRHLTCINPEQHFDSTDEEGAAFEALCKRKFELVIIDGVNESLGLARASLLDNGEVTEWNRTFPRRVAWETGAAVVTIDHVSKSKESRGRFAIGAQAKLASIDGAAYIVDVIEPLGKGRTGTLRLLVGKDRPGSVRGVSGPVGADRTQETARFTVDSTDPDDVKCALDPFDADDAGAKDWVYIMADNVFRFLENRRNGASAKYTEIEDGVKGNKKTKKDAVQALVDNGYVTLEKVGRAHMYNVAEGVRFYKGRPLRRDGVEYDVPEKYRFDGGNSEEERLAAWDEECGRIEPGAAGQTGKQFNRSAAETESAEPDGHWAGTEDKGWTDDDFPPFVWGADEDLDYAA
ncbi:AAA family ATPase [Arthrobacter sp. KK5.5]|uniref:AAA family ATPase n=1 Tax=Arthrobacter sp. KK5.5 TaxID=3373084 RepID=UPI003EE71348